MLHLRRLPAIVLRGAITVKAAKQPVHMPNFCRTYAAKPVKKPVTNNKNAPPPQCPPPQPPSSSGSSGSAGSPWKLIAGIGSVIVGGGIAWYMLSSDNDTQGDKVKGAPKTSSSSRKFPASSADIPKEIPYLLIGGGTASFTAFRAIKSHDATAKVLIVSDETEVPYMRPPLSKEMWHTPEPVEPGNFKFIQWNGATRNLYYEPTSFYTDPKDIVAQEKGGVAVCRGWRVTKLDASTNTATLDDGTEIKYGKCLIATGSRPKSIPVLESASKAVKDKISFLKDTADFMRLHGAINSASSIAIIGSGVLGTELACSLAISRKDKKIHQVYHEKGNMGKILPQYLSDWAREQCIQDGVNVIPETQITAAERQGDKLKLTLTNGNSLLVDHAVVAVGSEPNTDLAKTSNLELHPEIGGFVVNAELQARSNVYVAGDAACFFDPLLGRRRVEHHDHAVVSGRLAGDNMVGKHKPYTHQSMFWSDMGVQVGYEAIGLIDSSLPTTAVFAKATEDDTPKAANAEERLHVNPESPATPKQEEGEKKTVKKTGNDFGKGVVFYLDKQDKVVGILMWNIYNQISTARRILAQNAKYEDLNELAKLFDIHSQYVEK